MSAIFDFLAVPASWAWRVALETAIPIGLVLLLARLRWLPARWTAGLCLMLFARLLLPVVPSTNWRPDFASAAAREAERAAEALAGGEIQMPTASLLDARHDADATYRGKALDAEEQTGATEDGFFHEEQASLLFYTGRMPVPHIQAPHLMAVARNTLLSLWFGGVLFIIAWVARSHWRIRGWSAYGESAPHSLQRLWSDCTVRARCGVRAPLRLSREIATVAVHGFWRPVILVPRDLEARCSQEEIRSMFLHEIAHLRRHDVLWASLGLAACAVQWFNPLAWLLLRRFTQDREIVCDDFALAIMGHGSRRSYGGTLLRLLESPAPAMPMPAASFFRNHRELKHRLNNIMKPNHTTLWSRIVITVAVPAVCALALTTASADVEKKDEPRGEREGERGEEVRKAAPRDGETREGEKRGPRDGEARKEGARDGEVKKEGARDGDREGEKRGPRDGEVKKEGARDGDREGEKRGPRDGEMKKEGAREGDREGEGKKPGARDGDEGEKPAKRTAFEKSGDEPMKKPGAVKTPGGVVVSLDADGNVISSDGWVVPADTVRSKLQALAQANPDQTITLRANSSAPLEKVMSVLQIMKEAGIKNVSMGQGK